MINKIEVTRKTQMDNSISKLNNKFYNLKIRLASPEEMRNLSFGEVLNPQTISYKTHLPEKGGLFCQKIFGPVRDYNCHCGKYSQSKDFGKRCEACGVIVEKSKVRREKFGHIDLVVPVVNILMHNVNPSKIALFLDLKPKDVDEIVYYVSYIVIDPGKSSFKKMEIINQRNSREVLKRELMLVRNAISNKSTKGRWRELTATDRNFIIEEIGYYLEEVCDTNYNYSFEEVLEIISDHTGLVVKTGAEAIKELLSQIDIKTEIRKIKKKIVKAKTSNDVLVKKLLNFEKFYKSGNKLEWMCMDVILVLPPDIRPIVSLEGDKFSASEINEFYRRIIIRNERLKTIIKKQPVQAILNNEKRLLQEAVDSLLDNSHRAKPILNKNKIVLKSLSDGLKGKTGRFRQNLLGKRVDYSGRSVIVVGPKLKMYECGIPKRIAIELFKPFIICNILQNNEHDVYNLHTIENMINEQDDAIWTYLQKVIKGRPVLLNRAPTLHRLGIQAFEIRLISGNAIQLPPLSTTAFNADFDGDQMAVHLLLSQKSVAEARSLMLGSKNIIGPKDGKPIARLTQDMLLGIYSLTKEKPFRNLYIFNSHHDVETAVSINKIHLNELILFQIGNAKQQSELEAQTYLVTTAGKVILNYLLSDKQRYFNDDQLKKPGKDDLISFNLKSEKIAHYFTNQSDIVNYLKNHKVKKPFCDYTVDKIILEIFNLFNFDTSKYLDRLKDCGFKYSTTSGITVSGFDVFFKNKLSDPNLIIDYKSKRIAETAAKINYMHECFNLGFITKSETSEQTIRLWSDCKNVIQEYLANHIQQPALSNNSILQIADSGARGNISNLVQLSALRGLMVSPSNTIIEVPIKSSFCEGLTPIEFFISTHGARKGMADTALKTADSGYLTRRLVEATQDLIISEYDCKSNSCFVIKDILDPNGSVISTVANQSYGRYVLQDVYNYKKKLIIGIDNIVTHEIAAKIAEDDTITQILVRSTITCISKTGICQKCFGYNPATPEMLIKKNEPIGIIAAQSIGEPGTQLTMRTFHSGGVASVGDITQGLTRIKELLDVATSPQKTAKLATVSGVVTEVMSTSALYKKQITITHEFTNKENKSEQEEVKYLVNYADNIVVKKNQKVRQGDLLTSGNVNIRDLLQTTSVFEVIKYILSEVKNVYFVQGIEICEKYIELVLRKMFSKMCITNPGDSKFLLGSYIDVVLYQEVNDALIRNGKTPAFGFAVVLGLKKIPLESKSFLSAISFQDTVRTLTNSAISGDIDRLEHIKENVLLGNLMPCGSGVLEESEIIELGNQSYLNEY